MDFIVGGGPVGCYTAARLAKEREVTVLEEHSEIGKPVQCTGIVTKRLFDVIPSHKSFVVNKLKKVRIHAPDGSIAEIRIDDTVICRTAFDKHIADMAEKAGAKIDLNKKVEAIDRKGDSTRVKITKSEKILSADTLVGADGPNSIVSKYIGNKKPKFLVGTQARVKMPVDKDTYSVYFGDEFPGFFGWVVPENDEVARVGVAARKNSNKAFNHLMRKIGKHKILERQGGLIPVYDPFITLQQGSNYVIGDAATQVKATTGGGLVPGMKAAEGLARSIIDKTDYGSEIRSVNRELWMSLMLRKMLDRFNEKDYNQMISMLKSKEMQKILNEEDRDNPTKILFKTLLNKPESLLFARVLLRAKRL
ncbi:MAG: NAD(P)/FAD-dependent oxidoreductase [Candidatus Woesearchaeota archaeon]